MMATQDLFRSLQEADEEGRKSDGIKKIWPILKIKKTKFRLNGPLLKGIQCYLEPCKAVNDVHQELPGVPLKYTTWVFMTSTNMI